MYDDKVLQNYRVRHWVGQISVLFRINIFFKLSTLAILNFFTSTQILSIS